MSSQFEGSAARAAAVRSLRHSVIVLLAALTAVAATVSATYVANSRARNAALASREVARLARQALSLAVDRQSGLRAYLLTGRPVSLEFERAARAPLVGALDSIDALTIQSPTEHAPVRAARAAVAAWERSFAAPVLAAPTPATAATAAGALAGKELFAPVRAHLGELLAVQDRIYAERVQREHLFNRLALAAVLVELAVIFGVLVKLGRRLVKQATTVLEQQQQLEEVAIELEMQATELQEQQVELEMSNQELVDALARIETAQESATSAAGEVAAQRTFLRAVVDTIPSFVFAKDRAGRFTLANRFMADAYGTTPAALIGKTDTELTANAAEVEAFRRADLVVMDSGEDLVIPEEPITDMSGQVRWLRTVKRFLVSPDGRDQVLCVSVDITEHRRMEEQLRQAQKMDAVGQLAGGVAHDFNNVLTVITAYSQMVLEVCGEDDPRRADLTEIRKAAERGAALTRQLLAFSRKQIVQPRAIDLNGVIVEAEKMLRRVLVEEVALVTRLDPNLGAVRADPGQVEQVLMNLVLNARDAIRGSGRITIETAAITLTADQLDRHLGALPGAYALLAVTDTGSGMDRATQERVFEPFFTTKERGRGTGLGLSTVYGIAKQSGGDIWVYSEPGHGTTIKIYLPLTDTEVEIVPPSHPLAPSVAASGTILVVEDDHIISAIIERSLGSSGYRVLTARNGNDALRVSDAFHEPIDLVLTDVIMPEMGGPQLVAHLAKRRPGIAVIYMSGYTDGELTDRGVVGSVVSFIEKPFSPDDLRKAIAEKLLESAAAPAS
jgi:PAS domain S-box-containing protein